MKPTQKYRTKISLTPSIFGWSAKPGKPGKLTLVLLAASVLFFSCQTAPQTGESEPLPQKPREQPPTKQAPAVQLSKDAAEKISTAIAQQIERTFPVFTPAGKNASQIAQAENLNTLAAQLLQSYKKGSPQAFTKANPAPDTIEVRILETPEINSFAAGNRYIYLTRGMLACAKNHRQQAALIAHELAHISLGHSTSQVTEEMIQTNLRQAAEISLFKIVGSGYSSETEYAADRETLTILQSNGFFADDFREVLVQIANKIDYSRPDIAKTHPAPEKRLKAIK